MHELRHLSCLIFMATALRGLSSNTEAQASRCDTTCVKRFSSNSCINSIKKREEHFTLSSLRLNFRNLILMNVHELLFLLRDYRESIKRESHSMGAGGL